MDHFDFTIIGGGVMGLALAREIVHAYPDVSLILLEKESSIAQHASGRNSGVLHAGFYYTADSLKARFCAEGNRLLKEYCRERGLALSESGKLVVARNEAERPVLRELLERGLRNGVRVELVAAADALKIEPLARTVGEGLYSPDTATVDPGQVCAALADELIRARAVIAVSERYLKRESGDGGQDSFVIRTSRRLIETKRIINCAGLYADAVARDFGCSAHYTVLPFKGLYLKYAAELPALRCHIYPVPNLRNPFLGVHFTRTVDGHVKIGPTAIPAFWREHYTGISGFRISEALQIVSLEAKLFLLNSFGFRSLAFEEVRKYARAHLISLARELAPDFRPDGFGQFTRPGIRAQLVDLRSNRLVTDYVVEQAPGSVHVLNAVSPAFTSCLPFAKYVFENHVKPGL